MRLCCLKAAQLMSNVTQKFVSWKNWSISYCEFVFFGHYTAASLNSLLNTKSSLCMDSLKYNTLKPQTFYFNFLTQLEKKKSEIASKNSKGYTQPIAQQNNLDQFIALQINNKLLFLTSLTSQWFWWHPCYALICALTNTAD